MPSLIHNKFISHQPFSHYYKFTSIYFLTNLFLTHIMVLFAAPLCPRSEVTWSEYTSRSSSGTTTVRPNALCRPRTLMPTSRFCGTSSKRSVWTGKNYQNTGGHMLQDSKVISKTCMNAYFPVILVFYILCLYDCLCVLA